jgi:serine/threonine protein kinase
VHGDIKGVCLPLSLDVYDAEAFLEDNVLMTPDGFFKLTDFGLAVMHDSVMRFSETDPGGGTVRWMVSPTPIYTTHHSILTQMVQAPELYRENGERCFETDVYALGMVSDRMDAQLVVGYSQPVFRSRLCWRVYAVLHASPTSHFHAGDHYWRSSVPRDPVRTIYDHGGRSR